MKKKLKEEIKKKKIICISLGCNEHKVLKYLNNFEGAVSIKDIYNEHCHEVSMAYILQLTLLLDRLLRKKLVIGTIWEDETVWQITSKGRKMLEVLES